MFRAPGIPSIIRDIGSIAGSSASGTYCSHDGVTCAPASSSTCSTPRFRASLTPQGIMDSPRTRSEYSRLDSRTVTVRPAEARAQASADPAIPPPTITTSEAPTIDPLAAVTGVNGASLIPLLDHQKSL